MLWSMKASAEISACVLCFVYIGFDVTHSLDAEWEAATSRDVHCAEETSGECETSDEDSTLLQMRESKRRTSLIQNEINRAVLFHNLPRDGDAPELTENDSIPDTVLPLSSGPLGVYVHEHVPPPSNQTTLQEILDVGKHASFATHVASVLEADFLRVQRTLFPGIQRNGHALTVTLFTAILSSIWFAFYLQFICKDDRSRSPDRWKKNLEQLDAEFESRPAEIEFEYAFVFHHPKDVSLNSADSGGHDLVNASTLRQILPPHSWTEKKVRTHATGTTRKPYDRLRKFRDEAGQADEMMALSLSPSAFHHAKDTTHLPTVNKARVAFLQDMYEALSEIFGFTTHVYSSMGEDAIYVCTCLARPDVTACYLDRDNIRVQLRWGIVHKLKVGQKEDDPPASPPYMSYDPETAARLHKKGILSSKDEHRELYHTHHFCHGSDDKQGSIASSTDRVWIIWKEISDYLDIGAAQESGLMLDHYLVHAERKLRFLHSTWSDWKLLFDYQFSQPIHAISDYFGVHMGLCFAWQGLYCKALLALVLPAAIYLGRCLYSSYLKQQGQLQHTGMGTKILFGFSFVMVAWARIAWNMWQREQAFFNVDWDVVQGEKEKLKNAGYIGQTVKSLIDTNLEEIEYDSFSGFVRRSLSHLATGFCCIFIIGVIWMQEQGLFEELINTHEVWWVSFLLTFEVEFFEIVYNQIVDKLVNFENHKYIADKYTSYLWKQIIFQSVNNYFPFFLLSIKQSYKNVQHPGISEEPDNLVVLQWELSCTLAVLSAGRIAHVMFAFLKVKAFIWYKKMLISYKKYKGSNPTSTMLVFMLRGDSQGTDCEMSYTEHQADLEEFHFKHQCWTMLHPFISLGHTLMFGAAAPSVVLLCLLVFVITRMSTAILLTHYARRPFPHHYHFAVWEEFLDVLMKMGIFTTGALLVAFGDTFRGTPMLTRSWALIFFCTLSTIIWTFVDKVFPPHDGKAELLAARRAHVEREIMHAGMRDSSVQAQDKTGSDQTADLNDKNWDGLPRFAVSPRASQSVNSRAPYLSP